MNIFENYFNQFMQGVNQNAQNQPGSNVCPPAGRNTLSSLPVVIVTADDLLEESNKECIVCLEEQKLGAQACKLPCGHLFHKQCITEWLIKHCTCPVCRFELETDDPDFEKGRRKRMKSRKLRLRLDELKGKSIGQLRDFCRNIGVNLEGCLDKSEVIDKVVKSGLVDITEGVPQIQMTETDFNAKNVSELRHLLLSFGLSDEGALEKSELRSRLLNSDRVALIPAPKSFEAVPHAEIASSSSSSSSSPISTYTLSALRQMSLGGLRKLCLECGISTAGCIDKEEVVQRVALSSSSKLRILTDEETAAISSSSGNGYSYSMDADSLYDNNHTKRNGASNSSSSSSSSEYSNVYSRDRASSSSSSSDAPHQQPSTNHNNHHDVLQLSRQLLADFSIKELKDIMRAHGVDTENCLYRSEMIDRMAACSTIQVID